MYIRKLLLDARFLRSPEQRMQAMEMKKDSTITEVIEWLRKHLGEAFVITDHWDADLCAIGISAPGDPARLAFLSSWKQPARAYYLELETPSPSTDLGYESESYDSLSRDRMLPLIIEHLRIAK